MTFAGINYLAILIAAVVGWLAGAVYYGLLANPGSRRKARPWRNSRRDRPRSRARPAWLPFALAFVADLVMAWVLAGMVGHLGP